MRETVGLRFYAAAILPHLIKRDALMFRKIGVLGCDDMVDTLEKYSADEHSAQFRWLVEQGIVFDPRLQVLDSEDSLDTETRKLLDAWIELVKHCGGEAKKLTGSLKKLRLQQFDEHTFKDALKFVKLGLDVLLSSESFLRPLSTYYRKNKHMDVYPIFYGKYPELDQQSSSIDDVIQIAVKQLPVPDDSTPWEQIIDFRDDPDTEKKFLGLRNWMNDTARAKLTPIEVEQKFEWLLHEYQQHMKFHQMKTNASTLETIIVTGAEIAENLVKLQLGKLAKGLFSLRHRKLALLEGELKSPGREIAFISKAQETFR